MRPTCRAYSVMARAPLRILFCGSDAFSIASLRALNEAKKAVPGLVESIDVVHRPAKRTGRGLKVLKEAPISSVAHHLNLPTHSIDTFTSWSPSSPISLVIAVSFGLLVPPRILNLAHHGGLNVHPSLLPDLRGPAPIEHAILKARQCTGVSIQTLHPRHFDQGTVLAQTSRPGVSITQATTTQELQDELAERGAAMLVDVLRDGRYAALKECGTWYTGPISHAPKLTKEDRHVSFEKHSLGDVVRIQNALGDPWCVLPNGDRVILHQVVDSGMLDVMETSRPGLYVQPGMSEPVFKAADGRLGVVMSSTYEGRKAGQGNGKLLAVLPVREEVAL
ncbi:formyl transferase [Phaeosphaeria sp. MPI-PUGE-AT-0046c]|nr:formyl transferase [Phaeosphaeria sp. MPI-PUGE-AT-0046c]